MNDFTKEELQIIQWEINTSINKINMASLSCDKHLALIEKVQSMIDNYCEHDKLEFVGDVYGYDCKKCDKRVDSNHVGNERHERIINGEE